MTQLLAGIRIRFRIFSLILIQKVRLIALFFFSKPCNGNNPLGLFGDHEPNPLGVAANHRKACHRHTDDLSLIGNQHQVIFVGDLLDVDHTAIPLGGLDGDDTFAPAALQAVFVQGSTLAEAVFGHREDSGGNGIRIDDLHADHHVVTHQGHSPHPTGNTSHRSGILFMEADRFAVMGGEKHVLTAIGDGDADQPVFLIQVDGDDSAGPDVGVCLDRALLHHPLTGCHDQVAVVVEALQRKGWRRSSLRPGDSAG